MVYTDIHRDAFIWKRSGKKANLFTPKLVFYTCYFFFFVNATDVTHNVPTKLIFQSCIIYHVLII